jgi:hypothetical protein
MATAIQKGDSNTPRQPRLTGSTYVMPKSVKSLLASITDKTLRAAWKNSMIEAYVYDLKLQAENAKRKDRKQTEKTLFGALTVG